MRAAIIKNGIVTNVIVIDPDRYTGTAVKIGELPVAIGDAYDGTDFYRDGEKVEARVDHTDEYIEALQILGVEV